MADRIQLRRDTKANWEQYNPILLEGEPGHVLDYPNLYKMGDGIHAWNNLPYRGYNGNVTQDIQNDENSVPSGAAVYKALLDANTIQEDASSLIGDWVNPSEKTSYAPSTGKNNGTFTAITGGNLGAVDRPYFLTTNLVNGQKYRLRTKVFTNSTVRNYVALGYVVGIGGTASALVDINGNPATAESGQYIDVVFIADSSKNNITFSLTGLHQGDIVTFEDFSFTIVANIKDYYESKIDAETKFLDAETKILDAKTNLNKVGFIGKGSVYSYHDYKNILIAGHTYKFTVLTESWNMPEGKYGPDAWKFAILIYNSDGTERKRVADVKASDTVERKYTYSVPDNVNGLWFAVGGRITEGTEASVIFEDITDIYNLRREIPATFEVGYWAVVDGSPVYSGDWGRTPSYIPDDIDIVKSPSDTKLFIQAFDENDIYIGTWFGKSWLTEYDSNYIVNEIDIEQFRKAYPTYKFKLICRSRGSSQYWGGFDKNVYLLSIKKELTQLDTICSSTKYIYGHIIENTEWVHGTINAQGQQNVDANNPYKRIVSNNYLRILTPLTIYPSNGYGFSVNKFALDGTFISQFSQWRTIPYTIVDTNALYKVVIRKMVDEDLSVDNVGDYIQSDILVSTPFDRILSEISNVKAVNHRGYNFIAPENTLIAYEMSAQFGYKFVETDVLFTSDGVPVLMHDDTINRTARNSDGTELSETIKIEDITYQQALTYDYGIYKGEQFAGTKIPTFEEFMYCCKAHNLHPWIELKWTHEYTQAEIQQIISIVKQYGMEEHVSFISFSYDALALVRDEWDSVELGLNGSVADAELLKTGKNRVFMVYNQNSDHSAAVSAGFQVCVYTVDTDSQLNAIQPDVDSILTNGILPNQVYDAIKNKYRISVE